MKAFIFDLDGTLIDTEKYYRVCWPAALAHFGYYMSDEQYLSMRSLGRPFVIEQMKKWFGEDFDYNMVKSYRKILFEEVIEKNGIQMKPGARELLKQLHEMHYITAIATATDPERAERYLKIAGFKPDDFDQLCCATQVEQGKPSPEVYKFACKSIQCGPDECYAVEDSPNGVLSAYRAGCRVILIPDQTNTEPAVEKYCSFIKHSLFDIAEIL